MIVFIYVVIMAMLASAFVFVAALLRSWDSRSHCRKRRKNKYNLKK